MSEYFVTGATGAIGSALVPLLLQLPETRLTLLLRAQSADDLASRMDELWRFWRIPEGDDPLRTRVRALRGDVTEANFGLAPEDYRELCAACTHIVHSAGNVRMNLPIEQARRSSVDSARQVVELAHACPKLEKVEFVSTVGVGGRTRGTIPEEWLRDPRQFHNSYEQAKAEAEEVVRAEVESGLPLTVHRPSMVVGDSDSGRIIHFQVFYHLCEFLSGRRTFGLSPDFGSARLDVIPADYVARTIVWSSRSKSARGRIIHSCSGPELALPLDPLRERVREAFARAGRRLPPVIRLPTPVFSAILGVVGLLMPTDARRALRTLPVFLDYLATAQNFANQPSQQLLSAVGLPVPAPEQYLDRVLAYYLGMTGSGAF
ncbi:SDR family oxidoreductase [Accumulibacter sp.]|uniref:SDR family oxidoreductase n=1 Tax=Accumulibacter sp. TaxID=2053492 RepID=UPI0025E8E5B6|nr:SDR family oxidoreductase [Accumulibacter sp.]MCM8594497.1 SDR family oxidoreductase [Accumulibacter sp.]MCM8626762.1 SDR family oxidoreductase [Accumulibacter sp.]MDS4048643.1 SDR family oxidoreductase [Accumulibacter sp.]